MTILVATQGKIENGELIEVNLSHPFLRKSFIELEQGREGLGEESFSFKFKDKDLMELIVSCHKSQSPVSLSLEGQDFTDLSIEALADGFKGAGSSIQKLDLSGNRLLQTNSLRRLAEVVGLRTRLKELRLEGSPVDDEAKNLLLTRAIVNECLESLSLGEVGQQFFKTLVCRVSQLKFIISLSFRESELNRRGFAFQC